MAKNDNLTDFLTDVANAIRTKKGTTDLINPQDFSSEIESIQTGGGENKLPQLIDRSITEITTGDLSGITSIGDYAFSGCTGLTNITIPNSITHIGQFAFSNCSGLKSITIPNSITIIGINTFRNFTGLTNIIIPDTVTKIEDYAFYNCSSLTSITIPNGVTSIGQYSFYMCSSLTSAIIGSSIIGDYAFQSCFKLRNVILNNTVTSIGNYAFMQDNIVEITIPSSVTNIGNGAFYFSDLKIMHILPTTPPTLGSTSSIPSNVTTIEVPADSLEAYKTATNWSNFADKMVGV